MFFFLFFFTLLPQLYCLLHPILPSASPDALPWGRRTFELNYRSTSFLFYFTPLCPFNLFGLTWKRREIKSLVILKKIEAKYRKQNTENTENKNRNVYYLDRTRDVISSYHDVIVPRWRHLQVRDAILPSWYRLLSFTSSVTSSPS